MIYLAAILPGTICLMLAGYGWISGLSGWGWWLIGTLLLLPSITKQAAAPSTDEDEKSTTKPEGTTRP